MPFARNDEISQSPLDGGIEITDAAYAEALEAMVGGKSIAIDEGALTIVSPSDPIETAPPETLESAIARKQEELSFKRWLVEIGGLVVSGVPVRTDANSQAKVAAAYTMARLDPDYTVSTWEAAPGVFVSLSNTQLIAIGEAVRDHIQATFDRKAELHAEIKALDSIEAVTALDIEQAW